MLDQISKVRETAGKMFKNVKRLVRKPTVAAPDEQTGIQRLLSESDMGVNESYAEEE